MARGRKSRPAPAPSSVSKDTFIEFLETIDGYKQKLSDAQMANASAWKKAESLGIHAESAKLIQKLDKMSTEKRTDYLRAFDRTRVFMGWDAQLDLLEQVSDGASAADEERDMDETAEQPPFDRDDEDAAERGPAELSFDDGAERVEGDPMLEETAQEWDAADGEQDVDALDTAGSIFAAGKEAGLANQPADLSPHEAGSQAAEIWERGRAVGVKEMAQTEASSVADAYDINQAGHKAGYEGLDVPNPYAGGTNEAKLWSDGYAGGVILRRNEAKNADPANVVKLFGDDDGDEPDAAVIAATQVGTDGAAASL